MRGVIVGLRTCWRSTLTAGGIGARVRIARQARGLSLRAAAGLAGRSKSVLHEFETGVRPLDRLSHIDNLAGVLGVSRGWLLGQPAEPTTPRLAGRHRRVERIRSAPMDTELGEGGRATEIARGSTCG